MLTDRFDSLFGLMKTIRKIEDGVDVSVFRDEVFDGNDIRFYKPSGEWPHREAYHVFLRMAVVEGQHFIGNTTATQDHENYASYPKLKAWIDAFAQEKNASVCRVLIAALAPRGQIYRHADRGYYFAPRDRYHLVLQSEGGDMLIAGQTATLHEGEVWWINNKASHQSFNGSDKARIHLIVDLYPNSVLRRVYNYTLWLYLGLRPKRLTNYYFNWPQRRRATS